MTQRNPARPAFVRPHALALAAAALLAGAAPPAAAQFYDYSGAVSTYPVNLFPIDVNQALLDLTGSGLLLIGPGAAGSFSALAGATMIANAVSLGDGATGNGTMNVTGPGTRVTLVGQADFSRLSVGSTGVGTMTVSGGAVVDAASTACTLGSNGCYNSVGNGAGSTGTLLITGTGSEVRLARSFTVGDSQVYTQAIDGFDFGTPGGTTHASVAIQNGGTLRTQATTLAHAPSGTPSSLGTERAFADVLIDGAGSRWIVTPNTLDNGAAGVQAGVGANAQATITVSNGGNLTLDGTGGPGPNDFLNLGVNGGRASLTVTGTNSSLVVTGVDPVLNVGRSGGTASSSFSVLAGASASTLFFNVGRDGATATVLIDGAGSRLEQFGVSVANSGNGIGAASANIGRDGGDGLVTVSHGAHWTIGDGGGNSSIGTSSPSLTLGRGANSYGQLTIDGAGSVVEIVSTSLGVPPGTADNFNPVVNVGLDNPSTTAGRLVVSNGGKLILNGNAVSSIAVPRVTALNIGGRGAAGAATAAIGSVTVTGAGSEIALNGYDGFIGVGRGSGGQQGLLEVLDQAHVSSVSMVVGENTAGTLRIDNARLDLSGFRHDLASTGAGTTIGRGAGAQGTLSMTDGAVLSIVDDVVGPGMSIGGDQFVAGGNGTVSLAGGSSITFGGAGPSGALSVGRSGVGTLSLSGASTVDVGPRTIYVGREVGGLGALSIASGSSATANAINIGGNGDTTPGGVGVATVTNAGSVLTASGANAFIGVGRAATGALTVTDGGKVAATILSIGRGSGGNGTLAVSGGTLALSGQQTAGTLSGAALSVGSLGGTGSATIGNGSVVTITNFGTSAPSLNVGGTPVSPLGIGTLAVSGGSQIQITGAPGQAVARIGWDGIGKATFADNSRLDVGDGQILIGAQHGSIGTLSIESGSVAQAGYIGVGRTTNGNGGTATLHVEQATVNATTLEIGAGGMLTGNGGRINANLVVNGVLSPGDSPGRVTVNGGVHTALGASLRLDIQQDGMSGLAAGKTDTPTFTVDEIVLTEGSSFDFSNVQVTFHFLGGTDPNAFGASGQFGLDSFLLSQSGDGSLSGLSSVFGPGVTYNQVFAHASFAATSDAYDITQLTIDPSGTGEFGITAQPVPEPATYALWLAGLAAFGLAGRRRGHRVYCEAQRGNSSVGRAQPCQG